MVRRQKYGQMWEQMRIKGSANERAGAEGKGIGRDEKPEGGDWGGGSVVKVLFLQT